MADNHFDLVLVWDNLGGAVRVNGGGRATVTDPATGALVTVVQDGQSVTTVTADENGRVSFVAQQGIVTLTSGGLSANYTSAEQATAGAANAALAQDAQAAAETASSQAVAAQAAAEDARDEAVAAATGVAGRAWTLTTLPERVNAERGYNSASWTQDNVCTSGDYRYVVYWASDKTPHIAQQRLSTGAWSTFDLSTVAGNPLASPVAGTDGHNTLSVGVDSAGFIHVAGNQHNHPLRYVRSTAANSISAWTAPAMVGTNESSMSYPTFVTLPDGTLLFAYRDGASGDGDMLLNRYSTTTSAWTRLGTILDGSPSAESPYWNRLAVDDSGVLHLFYCWRGTGSGDTNNDFCYLKLSGLSPSGVLTAQRSDGTTLTLPVTHAASEVIIDTAASGSGLMNQQGADVDTDGHPHAAQWLHDGNGYTQVQHVWHDGTTWHVDAATSLTRHVDLASASDPANLARATVACGPRGTTYIVYAASYNGRRGRIMCLDVTGGGKARSEFSIADLDLGQWEPSVDSRALRDSGHLVMLLSTTRGNYSAESLGADAVAEQWGAVYDVDLAQMSRLAAGSSQIPRLRLVGYTAMPGGTTTITATSATAITSMPTLPVPQSVGALYFARAIARFNGTTADTTVNIRPREFSSVAASRNFGLITATGTATTHTRTPWMPLANAGVEGQDSWVQLLAHKSGSGNGSIFLGSLDLAVLDTWG